MKTKHILAAIAVIAVGILSANDVSAGRPNIVFICTDDQPQRAMGNMGDPFFYTPNMDRLVRDGVFFENSFVTTAICAVSRASTLTGQHMVRHGVDSFDKPLSREQMDLSYSSLLRKSGYRTAFLGKFAIGNPRSAPRELCLPADQFDLWYGFPQGVSYSQEVAGKKRYVTTVMEEKAISFMRTNPKGKPFLLIMELPEPHGQVGPWNMWDPEFEVAPPARPAALPKTMNTKARGLLPPAILNSRNGVSFESHKGRYQQYMATIRRYVARTDAAVGRILGALRDFELEDNTIVIFTSDNGSMWGAHGIAGKWNMYEESLRVPLIIRDPRTHSRTPGRRSQMALNIDLAPTMLAMAGVPIPDTMQGMDLGPILRNENTEGRKDWYGEHDVATRSKGKPLPRCEGVRTMRWKYIRYKGTKPVQEELFDLDSDPLELRNLAQDAGRAQTLAKLRARCNELRNTLR